MEPATIASLVMPVLTNYLPVVWKAAKSLGAQGIDKITDTLLDKVSESLTDQTWSTGRELIKKISAAVSGNATAQVAMQELAADPDNSVNQDFLKQQLQRLFKSDNELMGEIAALLKTGSAGDTTIIASGDRSVAAKNMNAPVITGDVGGVIKITIEK